MTWAIRITWLAILLVFLSNYTYAQTFRAGALAGISTSQVGGDGYAGFNKAGVNVGVFANAPVGKSAKFQFEIAYVQKGSRKNSRPDKGDFEFFLLRLDYIEIPVLFKFKHKSFFFEAGLYGGVLINFYIEDNTGDRTTTFEQNQRKQVKSSEFGGLAGLSYNLSDHIILNSRLSQSIFDVKEFESGAQRWLKSGWSNTVISFTFRYEFGKNS